MKPLFLTLAAALAATAAFAAPADKAPAMPPAPAEFPKELAAPHGALPPPPGEKTYAVTLAAHDVQFLAMASQNVGERCSAQAEQFCQLQLAVDNTLKSILGQMQAPPPAAAPAAPSPDKSPAKK